MESSHPGGNAQVPDPAAVPPAPLPPHNNNEHDKLATSLTRLSLDSASATPLPATPQPTDHLYRALPSATDHAAPSTAHQRGPSPLRENPSVAVNGQEPPSPVLKKRTSMTSLHEKSTMTPSRRTSSNLAYSPSVKLMGQSPIDKPAPPPVTAASVATAYFKDELDTYHGKQEKGKSKTIVVVHDSCYGHRFSRPRTTKANLNTIVERPERILASVLGVSTAYIRLGERHAEGRYPPNPKQSHGLPADLPFRLRKTSRSVDLTSPAVVNVHGTNWMEELKIMCNAAESKLALTGKELVRPSEETVNGQAVEKPTFHEGDLYLCSESLNAFEGALGGVCEGIDAVFEGAVSGGPSRAFVCIRPPGHHCSADYPSGFCWINNVHVGISYATLTHGLTHAAIIDFDLHHGDGSQAITWEHNSKVARLPKNASNLKKSAIGYFSLNDINSYPCEMGDEEKVKNASLCVENAHGQTIWNVHLQPWKSDNEFWDLYESRYMVLLEKARAFLKTHTERLRAAPNYPRPKAAIFISAGFDASEWEGAGMQRHKVNVPTDFYARFTRDIVNLAEEEGTGVEGRVISVLEGGYSDRALTSGVLSHVCGLSAERAFERREHNLGGGLGRDMCNRMFQDLNGGDNKQDTDNGQSLSYDPGWWSIHRLEELEAVANPPPPPAPPKKPRNVVPPTYSSPTQASMAKSVSSPNRTVSGQSQYVPSPEPSSRAPTPPPPDVNWVVAAHELSKLLIPSDRQTKSCRPEELNAEASRARKERHSTIGLTTTEDVKPIEGKRMQLRERKSRTPQYTVPEEDEDEHNTAKANRRKTIGTVGTIPERPAMRSTTPALTESYMKPTVQSTRRSSVASSVGTVETGRPRISSISSSTSDALHGATAAVSARPQPSSHSRPGSAAGSAASLSVKKTRTVSNARSDASKARGVKKEPPVPRIPSAYTKSSSPEVSTEALLAASSARTAVAETKAMSDNAAEKNRDPDGISDSMKKLNIKLKMPTKEEQYAREKARRAAEEKIGPAVKAAKKSAGKAAKKNAAASRPGTGLVREATLETIHVSPQKTTMPPPFGPAETSQGSVDISNLPSTPAVPPLNLSQAKAETPKAQTPAASQPAGQGLSDIQFVPYEPTPSSRQQQTSPPILKQEPLVWLPPNTSTPPPAKPQQTAPSGPPTNGAPPPPINVVGTQQTTSQPQLPPEPALQPMDITEDVLPQRSQETPVKRSREDLPKFTATSPIPFAKAAAAPFAGQPATMDQVLDRPSTASSSVKNEDNSEGSHQQKTSIWDVPDTPAKPVK